MALRPSLFGLVGVLLAAAPLLAQEPTFGFVDFSSQAKLEASFLASPEARRAGELLKTLTAEPHIAGSPEDRKTAEFVAAQFRAAGLETEIVPYRVRLNYPIEVRVEAWNAAGKRILLGPARERVAGDPYQDDPRVTPAFHGGSPSGEVTAEVVYANYCRQEDFDKLASLKIVLRGRIALCRYGQVFRGVKAYLAQQRGVTGLLIYSDPQDDGYFQGDVYPNGPWRPDTAVQRGAVHFMPIQPGDPETPGVASTLDLPDSARLPEAQITSEPRIVSIPLSYHDAAPILEALRGPAAPQGWQGALPFHYHLGPSGVKAHLLSRQDFQRRLIWNVIGRIPGADSPDEWVVAGNHRDAWVYGAADPSSGSVAMLEAVHGFGQLLKQGWRPRRTILFCSWDAEEQGLIGSTEWVEQHEDELQRVVAYFNLDVAVSGQDFSAAATPSLKAFVRSVARAVPAVPGLSVYDEWLRNQSAPAKLEPVLEPRVGDLGSGSDFSPFFEHIGAPSSDLSFEGSYGVYHSVFDNYAWFSRFADPGFLRLRQMAQLFGLETLRMAEADVLPLDYVEYSREIDGFLAQARRLASEKNLKSLDFAPAEAAAARLSKAASAVRSLQLNPPKDPTALNRALRVTERDLLAPAGLPGRPWYRHTIFAPGVTTGYSAAPLPGVNEAIAASDAQLAVDQLRVVTVALERAALTLESAIK